MGIQIPSVDVAVAKLSGGQRQAIAVARSVYSDAKILLLDEPLAAMGVKEGAIILDLVQDLKRRGDVSVIIIAHNYGQVLEVCDRVNLVQHGEITLDKMSGTPRCRSSPTWSWPSTGRRWRLVSVMADRAAPAAAGQLVWRGSGRLADGREIIYYDESPGSGRAAVPDTRDLTAEERPVRGRSPGCAGTR